jgi:hypothetical protein
MEIIFPQEQIGIHPENAPIHAQSVRGSFQVGLTSAIINNLNESTYLGLVSLFPQFMDEHFGTPVEEVENFFDNQPSFEEIYRIAKETLYKILLEHELPSDVIDKIRPIIEEIEFEPFIGTLNDFGSASSFLNGKNLIRIDKRAIYRDVMTDTESQNTDEITRIYTIAHIAHELGHHIDTIIADLYKEGKIDGHIRVSAIADYINEIIELESTSSNIIPMKSEAFAEYLSRAVLEALSLNSSVIQNMRTLQIGRILRFIKDIPLDKLVQFNKQLGKNYAKSLLSKYKVTASETSELNTVPAQYLQYILEVTDINQLLHSFAVAQPMTREQFISCIVAK